MTKLNRKQLRINNYDYSKPNYYFVTICTFNMNNLFGSISNNKMNLNSSGVIVKDALLTTISYNKTFKLDKYIIMPNHVHAIIIKNNILITKNLLPKSTTSISDFICEFKSRTVHKYIRAVKNKECPPFNKRIWQRSFYDHIIRNQQDYQRICKYINTNPQKWQQDKYFNVKI